MLLLKPPSFFIYKFRCFMLLLNFTIFRYSLFIKDYLAIYIPIFSDIVSQFLWFACSDFTDASDSSSGFSTFFSLLLSFFSISINNFLNFSTETGSFSCNFSEVLLHFRFPTHRWWIYQWITTFKLTGMLYYNRSSLMILVNNAKYIQFLSILSTSSSSFTLQV